MAKNNSYYFDNFESSIEVACEAAGLLKTVLSDFDATTLDERLKEMHILEHKGDEKKHEMTAEIVVSFITPLERDDIMRLSQQIDNITDAIEDVLLEIYMTGITKMREEAKVFADIVYRCVVATKEAVFEFRNFRKSKQLMEMIIEINKLEEEGDAAYLRYVRKLHTADSSDLREIMLWRKLYDCFEKCCDECEDVADVIESVAIGNS